MNLPRRYSYDPRWQLILFELAIGAAMLALVAARGHSLRTLEVGVVLASPLIVLALLLVARRLLFRRFIELQPDALLLPTGFFHARTARIPYADITDVREGGSQFLSVLWIITEKRNFPVMSELLPEPGSYLALRDFLLQQTHNGESSLYHNKATDEAHTPLSWRERCVRFLAELVAISLLYLSLLFAAVGHMLLFGGLIESHGRAGITILSLITMPPWLIVFTLTYFKRPILPPRAFCICLLVAMSWYAAETFAAELLILSGALPPESPQHGRTLAHILIHAGWLSFIPLIPLYRSARAHIPKPAT